MGYVCYQGLIFLTFSLPPRGYFSYKFFMKVDRDIFVEPPSEAKKTGVIWKLNIPVYGLKDAPRRWFLKAQKEFLELGFTQSGKNMAVFVRYKDDELIGLVVIHVDDFLHAGDDYFRKVVIPELRGKFEISTTGESNFRYTGININSNTQGIEIDQDHYISESVKSIPLESINKSKS